MTEAPHANEKAQVIIVINNILLIINSNLMDINYESIHYQ